MTVRSGLFAGAAILVLALLFAVGVGHYGFPFPEALPTVLSGGAHSAAGDYNNADLPAASDEVRALVGWITATHDNAGAGFVVVDKKFAQVHVFDSAAHLRASSPALLGAAHGDESAPDIGTRPIADVLPAERTTPAGRFVAERGHNARGEDVVWVDYDAGLSMHRVINFIPGEHRLERLATASVDDNRISYGCINLPAAFYEAHIRPVFAQRRGVVYVLPESKSMQQVFGAGITVAARR